MELGEFSRSWRPRHLVQGPAEPPEPAEVWAPAPASPQQLERTDAQWSCRPPSWCSAPEDLRLWTQDAAAGPAAAAEDLQTDIKEHKTLMHIR